MESETLQPQYTGVPKKGKCRADKVKGVFTESRRDVGRYKQKLRVHDSVSHFLGGDLAPGVHSIGLDLPLDLLYMPNGSKTTVVSFHAAARPQSPLPIFAGGNVAADHGVNRIHISDPGLYCSDNVRIAWFAGALGLPLQTFLPSVLAHLIEHAGGERTVFWGPSAGGFAALYYSKFFPNSLAIPVNPQTILANFGYQNQRIYTHAAFGAQTPDEHDSVLRENICSDLRIHYGGNLPNYVLYVQNLLDTHVELHMEPFLESLGQTTRIRTHLGAEWGVGHVAPTVEELRNIVSSMTAPNVEWATYFA